MKTNPRKTEGQRLLARIGWSQAELARRSGRTESLVKKLMQEATPPDPDLLAWLREVAEAIEDLKPPAFYDRRYRYEEAAE